MAVCSLSKPEDFRKIEQKDYDCINSKKDFTEKILAMTHILQLTDREIHERKVIQSDMMRHLKPFYPSCLVTAFGSSVNGFGFKGCDLDLLFLPFPEYCNLDFKGCEDVFIPRPYQILKEPLKFPKENLLSMNESCHLIFIRRIMYSKPYYFKRVSFIPAKCPILNIEFVKSHVACDFSATNRLVLCNTDLQWLYGRLDYRVRPVVMFLRYWAKSLGFIQKHLLSSYSFTFLVIFYLQNTEPPILPSVKSLIELSDYSDKIDEWETGICKNLNFIPTSENSASIEQLLMGFFDFYWNFDFIHNVVSPHTGKAVQIKELLESNDLRIRTFQVTPFSIQDPFILSRNISRNATMKTSFKLALLIAKRHLLQGDLFQNMFDFYSYQEEINKMFTPVTDDFPPSHVSTTVYLSYELCSKLCITNGLNSWYEKVCETVLDILQYGLLIECEVVDKIIGNKETVQPPHKKKKLDNNNVATLKLIMSIQCAAYYNTWNARRKIKKTNPDNSINDMLFSDVLQKEHNLSLSMSQGNNAEKSPLVRFLCNCYIYSSAQVTDAVLIFSPLSEVIMFHTVSSFLKSYVQKHVIKILSDERTENSLTS